MPINHFLLVFNLRDDQLVGLTQFGEDVDAATDAYAAVEREYREREDRDDFEIVLVGADSQATLEQTHSRYFRKGEPLPF